MLKKTPSAKGTEVVEAVKKEFGHTISPPMVYMIKTKSNMSATRKATKKPTSKGVPVDANQWIEAIKIAQRLLTATGSVENATALLEAVSG